MSRSTTRSGPAAKLPPVGALLGALLVAMLGGLSLGGCDDAHECTVPEGASPDWIRTLGCQRDYEKLWDERTDSVFSRTRSINWLIDREDGDRTYFINTRNWLLHFFFATAYLDQPGKTPVGTHAEFNLLNYRRPNRRFVLGKLVRYVDQGVSTVEFSAGDNADAEMIIAAFERISSSVYDGDELKYRPLSGYHESLLAELEGRIPIVRTEDVFLGQSYQALNHGVGYGTLTFRHLAELASRPVSPTDIVVIDRVPNDISLVSAIVTGDFQTPLSHVNILSKNRGTPNMALRDAFDDPALRAFEGKLVRLEVGAQDYTIAEADPADAQAYWDALRPASPLVPDFDLSLTALTDVANLSAGDAIRVGSKAANLGELTRITEVAIPLPDRPFAIPFVHYDAHLAAAGVNESIDAVIADYRSGTLTPAELAERLFRIRWSIYTASMDSTLTFLLEQTMTERWGADTKVRFRSSTNVEDLAEFSGAGLYTSAGARGRDGATGIANAVKVVWASAWNAQAFVEREFYRVDHTRMRMGVLVHPAFEDEDANGVALTINEFSEARPAYFINSQVGEVSVTNPTGQAIPEQLLYYTWYEEPEYEVITRSSLVAAQPNWPAGNAVMTETELDELATYLEATHNHFRSVYNGGSRFAVDVEFKLAKGRVVVLKQARPYKERTVTTP